MPVRRFFAGVLVAALASSLAACGDDEPKKKAAPTCPPGNPAPSRTVAWSSIYANVYNASETRGAGAVVARRLQWRGLHTLRVDNDPLAQERPTPKYGEIRFGKAGRTIALNLAQQMPHANLYQDDRDDPTVDVVVGNDFSLTPQAPRAIKHVSVKVYNTSFLAGLAATVGTDLKKQGFTTEAMANDKAYYPDDIAVIIHDEEGLPDAQRLQMSIPGSRLMQDSATKGAVDLKGREVRLYLGSKWPDSGKVEPLSQATTTPSGTSSKHGC